MLKCVRMAEYSYDDTYEVIFDWDNDRHWALRFKKGDSVVQIICTIMHFVRGIDKDGELKDQ